MLRTVGLWKEKVHVKVNSYGFQALDLNIEQEVTELQETIYDHIRSVRLTFTTDFVCIAYFSWWVRVLS